MSNIRIEDLANSITEMLQEYSEEVNEAVKDSAKARAKQAQAEIIQNAPKDTGEYASGWGIKTIQEDKEVIGVEVYNKKAPELTHILEHGHAKQNGGRVEGKPHIRLAEQNAVKGFIQDIEKVVKG